MLKQNQERQETVRGVEDLQGGRTEAENQKKENVRERIKVRHPDERQPAVRALVCEENIK